MYIFEALVQQEDTLLIGDLGAKLKSMTVDVRPRGIRRNVISGLLKSVLFIINYIK